MSRIEHSQEINQTLIDKVRSGKSPTPKDRRDRFSYGFNKSGEDTKIRIQKDILDSLKESDGFPPLTYPQDYIFDIAHIRANGNLGELIDDMSNITNPEEKFEMVKSENRILRERLHNALQREMKAIKTFQKLANDNRLLHLRLKEFENMNRTRTHDDVSGEEQFKSMNGTILSSTRNHDAMHSRRRHYKLVLDDVKLTNTTDKSTSTFDLGEYRHEKSTSTSDLAQNELAVQKNSHHITDNNASIVECKEADIVQIRDRSSRSLTVQQRRDLFKARSSPDILEEFSALDLVRGRVRSSSLDCQTSNTQRDDENRMCKSASSGAINSYVNVSTLVPFRKLSEKQVSSFSGSLEVVNEEADAKENKQKGSPGMNRSSVSSEENISSTRSASSDQESTSPCQTPSLESERSGRMHFTPSDSLKVIHMHSRSLPSALNRRQPQLSSVNIEYTDENDDLILEKENKQHSPVMSPTRRRNTTESAFLRMSTSSTGSTRSLPTGSFQSKRDRTSRKEHETKNGKGSSSDDSDKEERSSTPQYRRRGVFNDNNPDELAAGIRKFQKMISAGQLPGLAHQSDSEEDIVQACEAVKTRSYGCRRGSAVVQIPASSVLMDLHVATEKPIGDIGSKKHFGSTLSLAEDKRSSRWSSILRNRKKSVIQKDRLRMSEDLKEYLSTKTRLKHIDSERELSLYRDTHWTHLMKVTDETGHSRPLSDAHSHCLSEKEMKRREAVWELFHSEVVYLTAHLLVLKECFLEPLREIQAKGFLVSIDGRKIFSNLEDLCEVSAKFAKDLLHLFKNEQDNQFGSTASVVTAFTKFKWSVHPQYERYCLSYTSTLNYLETLKQMEEVKEFFEWCESDARCNRLKLTDLLVAPFQHFTKYPLLLKNIRKRTSEGDRQHAPLTSTIKSVEVLMQELEGNVTVVRNYQKLKELQKNLVWPSVGELDPKSYIPEHIRWAVSRQECGDILASPKRQLIYEGPLTLYENTRTEVIAFLFDDMLLLTKGTKKTNRHLRKISMGSSQFGGSNQDSLGVPSPVVSRRAADYTYSVWKQPLPIDRFVLHDLDEYQGNSIRNGFVLVHTSRFKQAIAIHTLQASSKDVKEKWISKLKETQSKWSEMVEQEISHEKNQDDLAKDEAADQGNEYSKTDSEREQESGTNSDSSNTSHEDDVFDRRDSAQAQARTTVFSRSDSNNHDCSAVSSDNSRLGVPERKSNRTVSEI